MQLKRSCHNNKEYRLPNYLSQHETKLYKKITFIKPKDTEQIDNELRNQS